MDRKVELKEQQLVSPVIYISNSLNPYVNLALEEYFLDRVEENQVILYLWQNENTIVIGQNQNPWQEIQLESFLMNQGNLARRLSGGGTVFHDLGNLNFTFVAQEPWFSKERQTQIICEAVKSFGLEAAISGRNDILLDGKKFSGNAYYQKGNRRYHHGTILINADFSKMSAYLTPAKHKMQTKGVKSVAQRVTNLSEYHPGITIEAMKEACIKSFLLMFQKSASLWTEADFDKDKWQQLTDKYQSKEWLYGKQSQFQYEISGVLSFGQISMLFQVEDGTVLHMDCYSDILYPEWITYLKKQLLHVPFSLRDLLTAIKSTVVNDNNISGMLEEENQEFYVFLEEVKQLLESEFMKD